MIAAKTTRGPGRRRARRLIPAVAVVGLLGGGGAWLVSAAREAHNAAHSAATT